MHARLVCCTLRIFVTAVCGILSPTVVCFMVVTPPPPPPLFICSRVDQNLAMLLGMNGGGGGGADSSGGSSVQLPSNVPTSAGERGCVEAGFCRRRCGQIAVVGGLIILSIGARARA